MSVPSLPTVGKIARHFDVPIHRVVYIIRSRGIEPVSQAGNARIFAAENVDEIGAELRRIDQKRRSTND